MFACSKLTICIFHQTFQSYPLSVKPCRRHSSLFFQARVSHYARVFSVSLCKRERHLSSPIFDLEVCSKVLLKKTKTLFQNQNPRFANLHSLLSRRTHLRYEMISVPSFVGLSWFRAAIWGLTSLSLSPNLSLQVCHEGHLAFNS